MEQLRKEYEGMDLTDKQILDAKNIKLTKVQITQLNITANKMIIEFNEAWDRLIIVMQPCLKDCSKILQNIADDIKVANIKPIEYTKGRKLKNWDNKRFYQ